MIRFYRRDGKMDAATIAFTSPGTENLVPISVYNLPAAQIDFRHEHFVFDEGMHTWIHRGSAGDCGRINQGDSWRLEPARK
jgi:hypothetical protein